MRRTASPLQLSLFRNDCLKGERVAITGKLSVTRSEAIAAIRSAGGEYRTVVSRSTTILIVGHIYSSAPDGLTKKLRNALAINEATGDSIRIVDQHMFPLLSPVS